MNVRDSLMASEVYGKSPVRKLMESAMHQTMVYGSSMTKIGPDCWIR